MASGDALAKGAVKAQFPPAGGRVSQEAWDRIWKEDEPEIEQKKDEVQKENQ